MSSPLALQTYCRELAEATLAPLDFVGLSMLVTAGAAIGQSVNIRVKRGWNEAPLLFGILVAQPGKTKSPVIRAVVKPLAEIDRRLREESALALEQWKVAKKAHDKDPDNNPPPGPEPPQRRAIVKDITRESLVVILADNPRGVSVRSGRGFRVGGLVQRVQRKGRFRSPVLAFDLGLCPRLRRSQGGPGINLCSVPVRLRPGWLAPGHAYEPA